MVMNAIIGSSSFYPAPLQDAAKDPTAKGSAAKDPTAKDPSAAKSEGGSSVVLSPKAQEMVSKLKSIDLHVRNHEAAHLAAGAGVVTGGASYTYQRGPDGGLYAVAGEVAISLSVDPSDPAATLQKAEQVQRAALAPSDPSGQDLAVAAAASEVAAQARTDLSRLQTQGLEGKLPSKFVTHSGAGSERKNGQRPVDLRA